MARTLTGKVLVQGTLRARSALHVGGFGEDVETDLPLARDGLDRLYVPGTSLAGPMREWCERAFGKTETDDVWGFESTQSREGLASHVLVEDAPVALPGGLAPEIRDGVGIDRETGTSAERIKHDRAVLPPGSELPFSLELELPDSETGRKARAMLGHLLEAMCSWRVKLGAGGTRGLGKVRLAEETLFIGERDLSSPDGVVAALRGEDRAVSIEDLKACDPGFTPNEHPFIVIEINWKPAAPVMVCADRDGIAVDLLPLLGASRGGGMAPILTASSVKGTLRSQSERIVRTVLDLDIPRGQSFLQQLEVPLVTALFGAAGEGADAGRDEDAEDDEGPLPGRGALSVSDCFGKPALPERWAALERAKDVTELRSALAALDRDDWHHAFHVAVDRWTGGAAEGMLYSALEPHCEDWGPIWMTLDLARVPDEDRGAAFALLLLLIRDMAEGVITLGFGANRGYGEIRVEQVDLACHHLPESWAFEEPVKFVTLPGGALDGMGESTLQTLDGSWRDWLQRFRRDEGEEATP